MMLLRDYQLEMLSRLKKEWEVRRSVMVQMPTGTGKTAVLAEAVREGMKSSDGVVWVVAHRKELVSQISETILELKIDNERMKAASRIRVYSVQWLSLHWEELTERPELIVIDEAHHSLADSYLELWRRYPGARKLGMTATPCRLDNKGFTHLFEVLLQSWSIVEFIRKGLLSPFDYVSIRANSREQQLVDGLKKRGADGDYQVKEMEEVLNRRSNIERLYQSLQRHAPGRKGIVYAISVAHAREIASYYTAQGLRAVEIDSRTSAVERRRKVEAFRCGELDVLVNVDVFSEGFDCPDVEFIQLARPTLSLAKYLQQVGRGLRKVEGKTHCILIDNVGLHRVFGLPTRNWDWKAMFEGRMRGRALPIARRLRTVYMAEGTARPAASAEGPEEEMERVITADELLRIVTTGEKQENYQGLRYYADDIAATVDERGRLCYVDLRSNRRYSRRPTVLHYGNGLELLQIGDTYYSRTRQAYTNQSGMKQLKPVNRGWYLLLGDLYPPRAYRLRPGESYASACLLSGAEERVYWLQERLKDGSLVLMDGDGGLYHAEEGRGAREITTEEIAQIEERAAEREERIREQAEKRQSERRKQHLQEITSATPFQSGTKWGLRQGDRVVVPPLYRMIQPPVGRYCVYEGNPRQWGVLRVDGKVEIEARYERVEIGRDNMATLTVWKGKEKRVRLG